MFDSACNQLGVGGDEIVHIGDRDHNDVKGPARPRRQGDPLHRRAGRRQGRSTTADAVCERHAELPAIVDRLAARLEGRRPWAANPRILVVDGYAKDGRDRACAEGGAYDRRPALRQAMLAKCCPGLESDIVYPADPGASLPKRRGHRTIRRHRLDRLQPDHPQARPQGATPQIEFARAAFDAQVPSFGSCWAAQIAVVAAGGACQENPKGREMGIARKIA